MEVRNILDNSKKTKPALCSDCKMCVWYTDCKKQCIDSNMLSLIPELGRAKQESLESIAKDVFELAAINPKDYIDAKGKTGIPGIGEPSLIKFQRRADLIASGTKEPTLLEKFDLPSKPIELYFDIEVDPTQDIVYLNGVVEKHQDKTQFFEFTAEDVSDEAEKKAWSDFWKYIKSLPEDDWAMFYYSKYERTQYRRLCEKYPDVVDPEYLEWFFDPKRSVDLLYDIVKPYTEWPTYNYSIKTLAQHLGFKWRDPNPSGAASIQWFNEWCKDKDPTKLQRILNYNEDDCRAMIVLKNKLDEISSKF